MTIVDTMMATTIGSPNQMPNCFNTSLPKAAAKINDTTNEEKKINQEK